MRYIFLILCAFILNAKEANMGEFSLDSKEIKNIATLANIDLLDSKFMQEITESKANIIAISDFINAGDFEINIELLASEILKPLFRF